MDTLEAVPEYESKKTADFRERCLILSMRANEAADVVEEFGTAVFEDDSGVATTDLNFFVERLRAYASRFLRIYQGEPVTDEEIAHMEEIIASVKVPKKQYARKTEKIEIAYLGTHPETGMPMRKRIFCITVPKDQDYLELAKLKVDLSTLRNGVVKEEKEMD